MDWLSFLWGAGFISVVLLISIELNASDGVITLGEREFVLQEPVPSPVVEGLVWGDGSSEESCRLTGQPGQPLALSYIDVNGERVYSGYDCVSRVGGVGNGE